MVDNQTNQSERIDANWLSSQFEQFEQRLNGDKSAALHKVRRSALDYALKIGLPTPRDEEWKYTNITALAKKPFKAPQSSASVPAIDSLFIPGCCGRVVFIDGTYSAELSELPKGIQGFSVRRLSEVLSAKGDADSARVERQLSREDRWENRAFLAMNTAFVRDGVFISVAKNASVSEPLQVIFASTGNSEFSITYPRLMGFAGEGSALTVVETHWGTGSHEYLSSAASEWVVEANARVDHIRLQMEGARAFHMGTVDIEQADNSTFRHFALSFGGSVSRQEVRPVLNGSGIMSELYGITVIGNDQHIDNYTVIDHAKPHSQSNEVYKGIYGGSSKGIFNGTIIVRPDAQKTNAIQSNNSILLSKNASSNAKPQLKIWADDVKCTHGATVGQLDENALFYLRARGIPEKGARQILIEAFASDVMERLSDDRIREYVSRQVRSSLDQVQK